MKKYLLPAVTILLIAGIANAGAIKVWVAGELLRYTDLNANFAHIHNLMVGGHGARLVNSDVSASAAISFSKLENSALIPKAWMGMNATCSASPCTTTVISVVTSVTRSSAGLYNVAFPARPNTNYAVFLTTKNPLVHCAADTLSTTGVVVYCGASDPAAGVPTLIATDTSFNFLLMDDI